MTQWDGFVNACLRRHSPNHDDRPRGTEISLCVIHSISLPPFVFGSGEVIRFFENKLQPAVHPMLDLLADVRVSSHFFIDRMGRASQFVSCYKRAWHAGASEFDGRKSCNDFSIGIELEGMPSVPFTAQQYATLSQLIFDLQQRFPKMTNDRIVSHAHIAPGRKIDPGPAFDWALFFHYLRSQ